MTDRRAYTLMELVLALSLSTVVLGLVATATYVQLGAADKSRGRVEEAQLARALLQRISEDLRNAVPFVAAKPATASGSTTGSAAAGTATTGTTGTTASTTASSTAATTTDASTTTDSSTTSYSGGINGSAQALQVETSRRARRSATASPVCDGTMPARLSDIRTVTYSLGEPGTMPPTERPDSSDFESQAGLYRRELDRAEFTMATQQGGSDDWTTATEELAPEVANLLFTYYDSTGTVNETWDSTQLGALPSSVRVTLWIRRAPSRMPRPGATTAQDANLAIYDMLVDLPNAAVQSSQSGGQGSQTSGGSTSGGKTQ